MKKLGMALSVKSDTASGHLIYHFISKSPKRRTSVIIMLMSVKRKGHLVVFIMLLVYIGHGFRDNRRECLRQRLGPANHLAH